MHLKNACCFVVLISASTLHAESVQEPLTMAIGFPMLEVTGDSDNLSVRKIAVSLLPWRSHANRLTGFQLQSVNYRRNEWSASGQVLSLIHNDVSPSTGLGNIISIGYSSLGGRQLVVTESEISRNLNGHVRMSGFLSRNWVDSPSAIDRGVHYSLFGVALEKQLLMGLIGSITVARTQFSDQHVRNQTKFRLIWDIWPATGITLQSQLHEARSDGAANEHLYFNPTRHREQMVLVGWRSQWDEWRISSLMGVGTQRVNQDRPQPIHLIELTVNGPLAKGWQLRGKVGTRQAASSIEALSIYSYLQLDASYVF